MRYIVTIPDRYVFQTGEMRPDANLLCEHISDRWDTDIRVQLVEPGTELALCLEGAVADR